MEQKNKNKNKKVEKKIISKTLFGLVFSLILVFGAKSASASVCGDALIDTRDGKSYATVQIGSQCWLKQNMNVGTQISVAQTNNGVIEKACHSDDPARCSSDGGLYNWDEAMQYSASEGAQGICPSGFHVPSDGEWKTLEMALGMTQAQADISGNRGTTEGDELKRAGLCQGRTPCGTSGFDALLSGTKFPAGTFGNYGFQTWYWTSTRGTGLVSWFRMLGLDISTSRRMNSFLTNGHMISVRCVGIMPPSPNVNLSASPTIITQGSSSTLSWSSSNATSCTASGGWTGSKSTSGSQSVSPASTTTYTLTCTGPGGSASDPATVTVVAPVSCNLPWGGTLASGSSVTAYSTSSVACGSSCASQTRTCSNGTLSGTYTNQSCSVGSCSCSLPWGGTIASGSSVTAYSTSSVACGSSCTSQSRTCTNTVLSGTYTNRTCAVNSCPPNVSLSASPTTIIRGSSSTLSWSSSNATSCTASGSWTGSKSTSGSQSVAPTSNSTYTLTCTGPGGSANKSATVTVNAAAPTVSFSANPTSIIRGSSSTLSWSSSNATSCTASNGWTGTKSTSGTQSVAPSSTTLYTITCTGSGGSASGSATVTVNSPAPTLTISASPPTINLGSSSTIAWSSTDATSCTASVAWSGSKSTSGSQSVTPASSGSLNYVLQCSGPGGSTTKTATLTVNAPCNLPWGGTLASGSSVTAYSASSVACGSSCTSQTRTCSNGTLSGTYTNQNCSVATCPPTLTLTANPLTISSGGSSTLTWTVNGATSCTASNNQSYSNWTGSKSTAGGTQSVSPTTSTQFSMTCSNAGGSVTRSQTVNVNATPPTLTFTANPSTVTQGGSSVLTWTVQNATGCWGETADGDTNWPAGNRDFANGTHTLTVWPPKLPTTTYSLSCWNTGAGVDRTATVTVNAPSSCALPWGGSIAHGASVDAYQASSVACGSTCTKQTRTCTNGTLSGTYTNQNCTVNACNAPTFNFTGNPLSITAGESSTLSWGNVQNATYCWGWSDQTDPGWKSGDVGGKSLSGGTMSVTPGSSNNYHLECGSSVSGLSVTKDVLITVNAPSCTDQCTQSSCNGTIAQICSDGNGDGCKEITGTNDCAVLGPNYTCQNQGICACTPNNSSCAANTCTGQTCNDGCNDIPGTKNCGAGDWVEVAP